MRKSRHASFIAVLASAGARARIPSIRLFFIGRESGGFAATKQVPCPLDIDHLPDPRQFR